MWMVLDIVILRDQKASKIAIEIFVHFCLWSILTYYKLKKIHGKQKLPIKGIVSLTHIITKFTSGSTCRLINKQKVAHLFCFYVIT